MSSPAILTITVPTENGEHRTSHVPSSADTTLVLDMHKRWIAEGWVFQGTEHNGRSLCFTFSRGPS